MESEALLTVNGEEISNVTELSNGGCVTASDTDLSSSSDQPSVSDQTDDSELLSGCRTPTDCIFDPFAPGLEDREWVLLAPKKNMVKEIMNLPRRQLDFDSCAESEPEVEVESLADEEEEAAVLELLSNSFLELIMGSFFKDSAEEVNQCDGVKTPTGITLLTGIAETCPDAPVPTARAGTRILDPSICRKLDFSCFSV